MYYRELEPPSDLQCYVLAYWAFVAPAAHDGVYQHRVMPDGCVQLSYLKQARLLHLVGPRLEALEVPVQPGHVFWGVRFRPGAAGAVLGVPCLDLRDAVGPTFLFVPERAQVLLQALQACETMEEAVAAVSEVLRRFAAQAEAPDALVQQGVAAIVAAQGQLRISELAEKLDLSERQFQRRFRQAVGLTPKQFARIRRFRASVGNVLRTPPEAWSRVAAEQGYADQAHLIREFQDLYGDSPTGFEATVRAIEHRDVKP